MRTVMKGSWLSRSSAIIFAVALAPLATLAQSERVPAVALPVAKALNDAVAALKAERCDDARRAIGELRLDRVTPYERVLIEQILSGIAFSERKYAEARQHLQNAIESGGLSEQEAAATQEQIKRIDEGPPIPPPVAACKK